MSSRRLTASGRCPECGKLQVRYGTDRHGHTIEIPEPCRCMTRPAPAKVKQKRPWAAKADRDRRRACICQLCDEPTVGKQKIALYCASHRAEQRAAAVRRHLDKVGNKHQAGYYERNKEKQRKRSRDYYRRSKKRREARNEYKRKWRKANRDKVRAQKERAALRNFRTNGEPIKLWREEVAAGVRKPKPARRNKHGERLCCNGLCRQVVSGRAKMCARCKDRLAREARQQIEQLVRRAA